MKCLNYRFFFLLLKISPITFHLLNCSVSYTHTRKMNISIVYYMYIYIYIQHIFNSSSSVCKKTNKKKKEFYCIMNICRT